MFSTVIFDATTAYGRVGCLPWIICFNALRSECGIQLGQPRVLEMPVVARYLYVKPCASVAKPFGSVSDYHRRGKY